MDYIKVGVLVAEVHSDMNFPLFDDLLYERRLANVPAYYMAKYAFF